jgi:hypothetical protein
VGGFVVSISFQRGIWATLQNHCKAEDRSSKQGLCKFRLQVYSGRCDVVLSVVFWYGVCTRLILILNEYDEQAVNPQEESFRMTAVRKAYQKAVLAPVHLVEQIWKEYESFENSISRALVGCLPSNQSQSLGVKQPPIVMHLWGSIKLKFSHGHPFSELHILQCGLPLLVISVCCASEVIEAQAD